jgi:hypothetical protein
MIRNVFIVLALVFCSACGPKASPVDASVPKAVVSGPNSAPVTPATDAGADMLRGTPDAGTKAPDATPATTPSSDASPPVRDGMPSDMCPQDLNG